MRGLTFPQRPRHPDKDLESILQLAEGQGWRVIRKRKYYKAYCPCGDHLKTIHMTPSNPNYGLNLTKWLERQPCWEGSDGG